MWLAGVAGRHPQRRAGTASRRNADIYRVTGCLSRPCVGSYSPASFSTRCFTFTCSGFRSILHRERQCPWNRSAPRFWIPFLVLGVSQVAGGRASDELVKTRLGAGSCAPVRSGRGRVLTPASWFAALTRMRDSAIALMCVLMFAHGFWITNFLGLLGDMFPSGAIGTIGIDRYRGRLGGMLSSLMIGAAVDRFSFTPVFAVQECCIPAAIRNS